MLGLPRLRGGRPGITCGQISPLRVLSLEVKGPGKPDTLELDFPGGDIGAQCVEVTLGHVKGWRSASAPWRRRCWGPFPGGSS